MNKLLKMVGISLFSLSIGLGAGILVSTSAQDMDKVFELRIYTATPGNLDNLHARFRDHTTRIFGNHGMKVVGYWTPTSEEESENTLVYMLEHASQDAADASWRAFGQDPEWDRVAEASNANGQILGGIERRYMKATDYSPMK
ncbi:MAG TPA: NIPSNAP family protein [Gammaproteobacteria bacterium]|nr:NIPSNAP family protein [Gammaproteobacteria bacterium]HIF85361.1 NIPSNAP family protein [Gammaproteobacteria bacterium]HIL63320.1 NIPSNAP family protein [Porticoccaceae bacterium]HIN89473.1 NIPSNAP family protein [Porticoccaceae bacterium]